MAEILFYHLERDPLEKVLPSLVEKSLERGWRCVVQASSRERVDAINDLLWTWRDDSFIPHGTRQDGPAERQPVYITDLAETPNGATVRFLVDGAVLDDAGDHDRLVYMFDGGDSEAVATAREMWRWAKSTGLTATYWQQNLEGRWEKKAG